MPGVASKEGHPPVQDVKLRLDAWRDAERRRDGLPLDSSAWQEAEEDARRACKIFHAEVAQVSARYAEEDFQARNLWSFHVDRPISPAYQPVAEAFPARWPQR